MEAESEFAVVEPGDRGCLHVGVDDAGEVIGSTQPTGDVHPSRVAHSPLLVARGGLPRGAVG